MQDQADQPLSIECGLQPGYAGAKLLLHDFIFLLN